MHCMHIVLSCAPLFCYLNFKISLAPILSLFFFFCFLFQISEYVERNDAILLVVIPASQAPEVSSSRALKIAKEYDAESEMP